MWMTLGDDMTEKTHFSGEDLAESAGVRISVPEIARRLKIGRQAVYLMLEQGIIPGVRLGRRWIVTREAYMKWERSCGLEPGAGLPAKPEVVVVH
jgi:excisionase family DNA binding protein